MVEISRGDEIVGPIVEEDKESRTVRFAALALGKMKEDAVGPLLDLLLSSNPAHRRFARDSLINIGPSVIPRLIDLFKDERLYESKSIILEILERLKTKEIIPVIKEAIHDNDYRLRKQACSIAAGIDDPEIIQLLKDKLDDPNEEVNIAALRAISRFNEESLYSIKDELSSKLLELYDKGENRDIILNICRIVGKLRTKVAENLLIESLFSKDAHIRVAAAESLGKLGSATLDSLLNLAKKEEDSSVREGIARALASMKEEALEIIKNKNLLKDKENRNLRITAVAALANMRLEGKEELKLLISALEDKEVRVRYIATTALSNYYNLPKDLQEMIEEALIARLSDESTEVRVAACNAIGYITSSTRCIPYLRERFEDPSESVRIAAATALAQFGRAVKNILVEALNNKHPYIREAATTTLRLLPEVDDELIQSLINLLSDDNPKVRNKAITALGRIGAPAITRLIRCLADTNITVRDAACEALGKIGEPAIARLVRCLEDSHPYVRQSASLALGKIGEPAIPALTELLEDNRWFVREAAAVSLGEIRSEAAVPHLIRALSLIGDYHPYVRRAFIEALGKIGSPKSIHPIAERLKDREWYVKEAAVIALGNINTKEVIQPLLRALSDDNPRVARTAALTLGKLGKDAYTPLIRTLGITPKLTAPKEEPFADRVGLSAQKEPPRTQKIYDIYETLKGKLPGLELPKEKESPGYEFKDRESTPTYEEKVTFPAVLQEDLGQLISSLSSELPPNVLNWLLSLVDETTTTKEELLRKAVETTQKTLQRLQERSTQAASRINERLRLVLTHLL